MHPKTFNKFIKVPSLSLLIFTYKVFHFDYFTKYNNSLKKSYNNFFIGSCFYKRMKKTARSQLNYIPYLYNFPIMYIGPFVAVHARLGRIEKSSSWIFTIFFTCRHIDTSTWYFFFLLCSAYSHHSVSFYYLHWTWVTIKLVIRIFDNISLWMV